jgi:hypothetical protein
MHSDCVCSRNLVDGCDGDLVSELAKCSYQHVRPFLFGPGIGFAVSFDKAHALMQDLPNQAAKTMGNGPDGGLIAQPRQQTLRKLGYEVAITSINLAAAQSRM